MCKCLKYAIGNLQIDRIKILLSQRDDRMISQYIKTMLNGVHKNNSLELIHCCLQMYPEKSSRNHFIN